jgi:uncharacterized protein YbjT (DUF2867 family)
LKVAISGANGYLGERLMRAFTLAGCEVYALTRHPLASGVAWCSFDLGAAESTKIPEGIEIFIHAAAFTREYPKDDLLEVRAAQALLALTSRRQIRFVFISSQASSPLAQGYYGLTKHRIEQLVLMADGQIIRPGQVFGGPEKGLFGDLVQFLKLSWVVPRFVPAPMVHPVHVDDLARVVVEVALAGAQPGQIHFVGSTAAVEFHRFLSIIAQARGLGFKLALPIPAVAVKLGSRILPSFLVERLGLARLNSLLTLPSPGLAWRPSAAGQALRSLGFGAYRSGDGRRRMLLIEGRRLLTRVLRETPCMSVLIRYVRCVEFLGQSASAAEAVLEPISEGYRSKGARLDIATLVAEASLQGARRFLGTSDRKHWLSTCSMICLALAVGFVSGLVERLLQADHGMLSGLRKRRAK